MTLEDQAGQPIENPVEMDLKLSAAVQILQQDATYVSEFQMAYESPPSEATLRKALASFVRTLVSNRSAYDRYLRGETAALDERERIGLDVFLSDKTGCFHCHPGGALTNDGFFNNGGFVEGGDVGRQAITGRTGDKGKFKVPGLRNVGVTGPYMHDGSVATLEEVVDRYARGGLGDASTDPQVRPFTLTDTERQALLAFLRALTDDAFVSDPRFRP